MKKRIIAIVQVALFAAWGLYCVTHPVAHAQAPAPVTLSPAQAQQMLRDLSSEVQGDEEVIAALKASAVDLRRQLQQEQQRFVPACTGLIEKGNPGKTVDSQTWTLKEKPAEPAKQDGAVK